MMITSPLKMRLVWFVLLVVALVVPLYFLGIDLRGSEECAPEIDWSVYDEARRLARWTWLGSLVVVGGVLAAVLRFAPSQLRTRPVVLSFGVWKLFALAASMVTSPSCFESYDFLLDRYTHPLEGWFGLGMIIGWGVLNVMIAIGLVMGPRKPAD